MFSSAKLLVATISADSFTDELYETGLALLDRDSQARIKRFFHRADSYRCLLGRLLPRLVLLQFGFRTDDILFSRTDSGKPFLVSPRLDCQLGFNISHDQGIVVMAFQTLKSDPSRTDVATPQPDRRVLLDPSAHPQMPSISGTAEGTVKHSMTNAQLESITMIGVDVMKIALPRFAKNLRAFVSSVEDTLASSEKAFLISFCPPENLTENTLKSPEQHQRLYDGLHYLFVIWTLKEAYTKALGMGLGFDFRRIECRFRSQCESEKEFGCAETDVRILIDGLELKDWDFQICQLRVDDDDKERYQVAIARYTGMKSDRLNSLGGVVDRGIVQCYSSDLRRRSSNLDTLKTQQDVEGSDSDAQRLRTSSNTATEADMDGQKVFGPLGTDEFAVLRASSQLQELELRGNDGFRAIGDFDDDVFKFQSYDASTVVEIVSVLSTLAGSAE